MMLLHVNTSSRHIQEYHYSTATEDKKKKEHKTKSLEKHEVTKIGYSGINRINTLSILCSSENIQT